MTFEEYEVVRLRRSIPSSPVAVGAIGAIVAVYDGGRAYEVEFCGEGGVTLALLTLEAADLEKFAE
jgi:Domain of unknown function (DUF4926)